MHEISLLTIELYLLPEHNMYKNICIFTKKNEYTRAKQNIHTLRFIIIAQRHGEQRVTLFAFHSFVLILNNDD